MDTFEPHFLHSLFLAENRSPNVMLQLVSADKWPVTRAIEQQRKCKGNIFVLSCYKEWALKLIFSYTFGNSSILQCRDNCFSEFKAIQRASMVHANIHCVLHSILCGTYKHLLCTPWHIMWYIQTFIVHTMAYCVVNTNIHCAHQSISCGRNKHSLFTPWHIV